MGKLTGAGAEAAITQHLSCISEGPCSVGVNAGRRVIHYGDNLSKLVNNVCRKSAGILQASSDSFETA